MNEQNADYLKNQLRYTGFGEELNAKLDESISLGKPEFTLFHSINFGKDSVVATLHFKKSDTADMYFFNRYNLLVKNSLHPDAAKHTFYINKNEDNITLKEAYNLMCGRAVYKELTNKEQEKYNAWIQLDFKQKDNHENFAMKKFNDTYFRLEETLAKYPIKDMLLEDTRDRMVRSLQRGNMQMITLGNGEQSRQLFVEVAPQFKSLNFYDSNMKRVMRESITQERQASVPGNETAKSVKQDAGAADEERPANKNKKRKKVSVE